MASIFFFRLRSLRGLRSISELEALTAMFTMLQAGKENLRSEGEQADGMTLDRLVDGQRFMHGGTERQVL